MAVAKTIAFPKSNSAQLMPTNEEWRKRRSIYLELESKGSKATQSNRGVQAFFVAIDPLMASQIISSCINPSRQRALKKRHIAMLSTAMKTNEFVFNGDTIRFNDEYELCDGQHRLNAVVDSATTQMFLVVGNVPQEVMPYIDQNGKQRNLIDRLKLGAGYEISTLEKAVFFAMVYGPGKVDDRNSIQDNLEKWQTFERSVRFAARLRTPGTQPLKKAIVRAIVAKAHFMGEDVERLDQFLTAIDTQLAFDKKDSAALVLSREYRKSEWARANLRSPEGIRMYWDTEILLDSFLKGKEVKNLPGVRNQYKELWEIEGVEPVPYPTKPRRKVEEVEEDLL